MSLHQPSQPQRKPTTRGIPPTFVPPPPGATLNYATPAPPRKPWHKRARNWVRYHLEDRVGNAIMWVVGVPIIGLLAFIMVRPITTMRLLLHFFGHSSGE